MGNQELKHIKTLKYFQGNTRNEALESACTTTTVLNRIETLDSHHTRPPSELQFAPVGVGGGGRMGCGHARQPASKGTQVTKR
jgi:hypothetical protein